MANIQISRVCNLHCSYCFAREHMEKAEKHRGPAFISLEHLLERLDFLDRSGIDQMRFIGGEPTLHPQFPELVRQARQRHKHIVVFSNGTIPDRSLACLEALSPDDCTVLLNTNATRADKGFTEAEQKRRETTIKRLNSRILLGFNIYQTNFKLDFLLPIILEAGCRKAD